MNLKQFLLVLDGFFGAISTFIFAEYAKLAIIFQITNILSNIDNSIKVASSALAFIYFGFRIYFYVMKSNRELKRIDQETIELELKNKSAETKNLIYHRNWIEDEDFENSEKRIKKE